MSETFKNIWEALEEDPAERETMKIKSKMMMEIAQHIESIGITQAQSAKLMGVSQPRVSELINGKIDRFTIDMLVTMLARLGLHVEVSMKAA
ncbi:MAG: XRE family transcriptional regulator [Proteobacteria bacterium]|nr:XRE family transcriptional regulator [Pseudomonadota bacterium]MBU4295935.1 XRE family transcriptional regulator [Pseudomonadota bacterium]MCG2746145.1 XRE family transcriptional regulator [Desulfobulbaceae bacterium]